MSNRCIVNLATTLRSASDSNNTYIRGQQRLLASAVRFGVPMMHWTDDYPPGSPTHAAVPYAFKVYAFLAAAEAGATSILWCDANVWAQHDPAPVFDLMERQGHVFFKNWFNCGEWCTDAALAKHGLTRDAAMHVPDITACCMGLDLTNERAQRFLREWKAAADDGVSFIGDWTNDRGQCSPDKRCRGHRHDQVIASILAHRLEMELTPWLPLFSYRDYEKFNADVVMVNGR